MSTTEVTVSDQSVILEVSDAVTVFEGGPGTTEVIEAATHDILTRGDRTQVLEVGTQGPSGPAGPTGPTGPAGADGSEILTGSGVPSAGLGDDGDFYVDNDSGDYYLKVTGAWVLQGNLKGPQGDPGTGEPFGEVVDTSAEGTYTVPIGVAAASNRYHQIRVVGGTSLELAMSGFAQASRGQSKVIRISNSTGGNLDVSLASGNGNIVSAAKLIGGAFRIAAGQIGMVVLRVYDTQVECVWECGRTTQ